MEYKYFESDVLVIGAGLAGICAALEAAEKGASVRIISKGPRCTWDVSGFNAPVGPEDSVELFVEDIKRSGAGINNPDIISTFAERAAGEVKALEELGLEFDRDGEGYHLLQPLACSVPRLVHIGTDTGRIAENAILAKLSEYGVSVEHPVTAQKLLVKGGRLLGAAAYASAEDALRVYAAKAVVIAAGGASGLYDLTTYNHALCGDGIAMAKEAGADIIDLDLTDFEPCSLAAPEKLKGTGISSTMLFAGAKLLNSKGESVVDKHFTDMKQVNKRTLSAAIRAEFEAGNDVDGALLYDFTAMSREELLQHEQLLPMLEKAGLDPCNKPLKVAPAVHTTLGGIKVGTDCASTVPGLFACGEAMGGLHGAARIGGNAGAETFVFGRIAGGSAAEYSKRVSAISESDVLELARAAGSEFESASSFADACSKNRAELLWKLIGEFKALRKENSNNSICI